MVVDGSLPASAVSAGEPSALDSGEPAGSGLRHWLIRRATELRGRPLAIDPDIDARYLGSVVLERGLMAARGVLRFPARSARPFVGRRVRLRSKRRLTLGRGVTLGHGCLVDATSRD